MSGKVGMSMCDEDNAYMDCLVGVQHEIDELKVQISNSRQERITTDDSISQVKQSIKELRREYYCESVDRCEKQMKLIDKQISSKTDHLNKLTERKAQCDQLIVQHINRLDKYEDELSIEISIFYNYCYACGGRGDHDDDDEDEDDEDVGYEEVKQMLFSMDAHKYNHVRYVLDGYKHMQCLNNEIAWQRQHIQNEYKKLCDMRRIVCKLQDNCDGGSYATVPKNEGHIEQLTAMAAKIRKQYDNERFTLTLYENKRQVDRQVLSKYTSLNLYATDSDMKLASIFNEIKTDSLLTLLLHKHTSVHNLHSVISEYSFKEHSRHATLLKLQTKINALKQLQHQSHRQLANNHDQSQHGDSVVHQAVVKSNWICNIRTRIKSNCCHSNSNNEHTLSVLAKEKGVIQRKLQYYSVILEMFYRKLQETNLSQSPIHQSFLRRIEDAEEEEEEEEEENGKSNCVICMDVVEHDLATALPCSHTFHTACVSKWLHEHPACPICKLAVICDTNST